MSVDIDTTPQEQTFTEKSNSASKLDHLCKSIDSQLLSACKNGKFSDVEYLCNFFNPQQSVVEKCIECCMEFTIKDQYLIMVFLINKFSIYDINVLTALSELKDQETLSEICLLVPSLYTFIRRQVIQSIFPSLCSLKMEVEIVGVYDYLTDPEKIRLMKIIIDDADAWSKYFVNYNLVNLFPNKDFTEDLSISIIGFCLFNKKEYILEQCDNLLHIEMVLSVVTDTIQQWTPNFINDVVCKYVKKNGTQKQLIQKIIESEHVFDKQTIGVIVNDIYWGSEFENVLGKFIPDIIKLEITLKPDAYKLIKSSKALSELMNSKKDKHYYLSVYSFDELLKLIVSTNNSTMFKECVVEIMTRYNNISTKNLHFYNHPIEKVNIEINYDAITLEQYNKVLEDDPLAYIQITRHITTFSKNVNIKVLESIIQNELFCAVSEYDAFAMLNHVKEHFELAKIMMSVHEFYVQHK